MTSTRTLQRPEHRFHSPPCSALLFDLDGTLVDSRRDIAEALNAALVEATGREPLSIEAILPMIGDGARALVARALASGGSEHDAHDHQLLEHMVALFMRRYAEKPVVHTRLLPGAREALALGLPSAVVTNKPRAVSVLVLEQLGIAGAFGAVFAGGDGPLKPSPHGVLEVTRKLGVRIDHAWLIGDGPQDVLAGRAAGCFTIAVPGIADRERVLEAEPHLVVESLLDVARLAREAPQVTSA